MGRTKQCARKSTGGKRHQKKKASAADRRFLRLHGVETGIPWAFVDFDGKYMVLVQWKDGPNGEQYDDTWEAANWMRLQGFDQPVDLVVKYKTEHPDGTPDDFIDWCKEHPDANYIGASADGRCAFRALQAAMDQLENSTWTSEALVDEFAAICESEGRPLPKHGVVWPILRRFAHFANGKSGDGTRELNKKVFDKNLLPGTVLGVEALNDIDLAPGVYVCAARNRLHVGHCFALVVFADLKLVLDEDVNLQDLIPYGEWISGVYFLRKVELL